MWQEVSTADKIPSNLSSVNAFAIVTAARTYTCVCDSQEEARCVCVCVFNLWENFIQWYVIHTVMSVLIKV